MAYRPPIYSGKSADSGNSRTAEHAIYAQLERQALLQELAKRLTYILFAMGQGSAPAPPIPGDSPVAGGGGWPYVGLRSGAPPLIGQLRSRPFSYGPGQTPPSEPFYAAPEGEEDLYSRAAALRPYLAAMAGIARPGGVRY